MTCFFTRALVAPYETRMYFASSVFKLFDAPYQPPDHWWLDTDLELIISVVISSRVAVPACAFSRASFPTSYVCITTT